jgi:hypothetical protein
MKTWLRNIDIRWKPGDEPYQAHPRSVAVKRRQTESLQYLAILFEFHRAPPN